MTTNSLFNNGYLDATSFFDASSESSINGPFMDVSGVDVPLNTYGGGYSEGGMPSDQINNVVEGMGMGSTNAATAAASDAAAGVGIGMPSLGTVLGLAAFIAFPSPLGIIGFLGTPTMNAVLNGNVSTTDADEAATAAAVDSADASAVGTGVSSADAAEGGAAGAGGGGGPTGAASAAGF